jgi:Ribbon-helix-helix protein, copG family
MGRSITVEPKKRGRGRPATGRDPHIALRVPPEMLAEIDDWAQRNDLSRSKAMRELMAIGLITHPGARGTAKTNRGR